MAEPLRCVQPESVITGWDFSTGGVKCLAFDLEGRKLADVRLPTDIWFGEPDQLKKDPSAEVSELNLMQLEGQARASTRAIVARLREAGRLQDWIAGGISATHHTAGRIDHDKVQVRRAICWNDQTLGKYRQIGETRLGGKQRVSEFIGGPWADRYSLSHLVKDDRHLRREDWARTYRILPHGPLAAGYLTGNFDVTSVSSAASTGIMDLRCCQWSRQMLGALASDEYEEMAWNQLPQIIDHYTPVGPLAAHLAEEVCIEADNCPLIFPTSDDQQAGLVGGGAVDDGQVAVILGNSAVVNSSSAKLPQGDELDVMRLNWGPYLWMRCYTNGAQFLDTVVGKNADFDSLQRQARNCPAGVGGTIVLPFTKLEPSLKITSKPKSDWFPSEPQSEGERFRAALESIAYLIYLGVDAHTRSGQKITRITVSGGIARSDLMCEILASVLDCRLERLQSDEGPALGAAVTALAAVESHRRRQQQIEDPFTVADAVAALVRYSDPVDPNPEWTDTYRQGLRSFTERLKDLQQQQA